MRHFRTLALLAGLTASLTARADELAELVKRVPADMNTIAVINVAKINQSSRAMKEKWKENHETEYLAGALAVPAWVKVVVVSTDLQPGGLAHANSLVLVPVDRSFDSRSVAKSEGGSVQLIGDTAMVLSPRRGYIGFVGADIIGISSTMPRQDFTRWLRQAKKPEKAVLSGYLNEVVAANKDAHVLVATDLQDLFDPNMMRVLLQQAGLMGDANIDSVVNVITGAKGLSITATIGDATKAQLKIDFAIPMQDFAATFQKLLPKAMEYSGLEIEEFKTVTPKAEGKSLVWSTDLTDGSLRKILSVIRAPGDALNPEKLKESPIKTPKEAAGLAASLRYYKAVNAMLEDLRIDGNAAKNKDYNKSALYFETYAGKINRLPLSDVDPMLIQYGTSVATKLQAMADSLRGLKIQLEAYDTYKSTTYANSGGVYVTPRGRVGIAPNWNPQMSTNVQELSTKQAELVAKLEPERAKIWSVLQSDRSAVRREMLEKYKIDFDQYKR